MSAVAPPPSILRVLVLNSEDQDGSLYMGDDKIPQHTRMPDVLNWPEIRARAREKRRGGTDANYFLGYFDGIPNDSSPEAAKEVVERWVPFASDPLYTPWLHVLRGWQVTRVRAFDLYWMDGAFWYRQRNWHPKAVRNSPPEITGKFWASGSN